MSQIFTTLTKIERKQVAAHPGLTFYRITSADFDSVQREVENLIDSGKGSQGHFTLPLSENGMFIARGVLVEAA